MLILTLTALAAEPPYRTLAEVPAPQIDEIDPGELKPRGEITPPADRAGIDAGIRQAAPALGACWAAHPPQRSAVPQRGTLRFTIQADGGVSDVRLPERWPEALVGCVTPAIEAIAFPPVGEGFIVVSYPLVFAAQ